jgi:hypothetical protein
MQYFRLTACCDDQHPVFLLAEGVELEDGLYVYSGTSNLCFDYLELVNGDLINLTSCLIPDRCYTVQFFESGGQAGWEVMPDPPTMFEFLDGLNCETASLEQCPCEPPAVFYFTYEAESCCDGTVTNIYTEATQLDESVINIYTGLVLVEDCYTLTRVEYTLLVPPVGYTEVSPSDFTPQNSETTCGSVICGVLCSPTPGNFSYRLEDCAEIQEDIITNFDLFELVGQVITLRDETNKPLDGCWKVFRIPYRPVEEDIVLGVYKCYDDCEDCLPPAPHPYPLKPRTVDPNYTTGNCDPDIVEGVFCKHAESEYKKVLNKRFGIKDCCPEDEDKIYMNNEKIKLLLIQSKNPTPDPCSTEPIINEYYLGRNNGDAQISLSYVDINGFNVTFTIPACVGICEPIRFCAVRATININGITTYAVNEACANINNCISNTNLVFVRACNI